jgi:hypothetical protein
MDSDETFEDSCATMPNCGWQVTEIARHFDVTSEQVVLAIRLHTRQERELLSKVQHPDRRTGTPPHDSACAEAPSMPRNTTS